MPLTIAWNFRYMCANDDKFPCTWELLHPYLQRLCDYEGGLALRQLACAGSPAFLDSIIAATALEHDLTLVTRNIRDFVGSGVKLIAPWNPNW